MILQYLQYLQYLLYTINMSSICLQSMLRFNLFVSQPIAGSSGLYLRYRPIVQFGPMIHRSGHRFSQPLTSCYCNAMVQWFTKLMYSNASNRQVQMFPVRKNFSSYVIYYTLPDVLACSPLSMHNLVLEHKHWKERKSLIVHCGSLEKTSSGLLSFCNSRAEHSQCPYREKKVAVD